MGRCMVTYRDIVPSLRLMKMCVWIILLGAQGRGIVGYRHNNAMNMFLECDAVPGYDGPRAQMEDTNGLVMA
jgi:hypothetical protein